MIVPAVCDPDRRFVSAVQMSEVSKSESSRPVKRQRITDQSNNQTQQLDDIINQSTNQSSINQSINQQSSEESINSLSNIAPDALAIICSYLTLDTKLTKLPTLNQSINQLFNPSLHCRDDSVSINQSQFSKVIYCRSIDSLMSAVPILELKLDEKDKQNVASKQQSVDQSVTPAANQPVNEPINQSSSQLVSQSVDQSVDRSISQSVDQSINQSTSQSINPLVSVARAVLGNKLQTFRYSEIQYQDNYVHGLSQLVDLIRPQSINYNQYIKRGRKKSISRKQEIRQIQTNIRHPANQRIKQASTQTININQSINFIELFISLEFFAGGEKLNLGRPVDLTPLFGPNLHTIDLDVPTMNLWMATTDRMVIQPGKQAIKKANNQAICHPDDGQCVTLERTLLAMPPTLTYLKLNFEWVDEERDLQKSLLANTEWLPRIRHFQVNMPFIGIPELWTVMKLTGQPRPYTWIALIPIVRIDQSTNQAIDNDLCLHQFPHLKHLKLFSNLYGVEPFSRHVWFQSITQPLTQSIDPDWMPQLNSLDLSLDDMDGTFDLNPLIIHASKRPMEKLKIQMDGHLPSFVPFSDRAIQSIGEMHLLTSLDLRIPSRWFDGRKAKLWIAPQSWPFLKSLRLVHMNYSLDGFAAFLSAAPMLEEVYLDAYFEHRHLPILSIYQSQISPMIRTFTVEHKLEPEQAVDEDLLEIMHNAGTITSDHLTELRFCCPRMENKAVHMLINKLKQVKIETFLFPPVFSMLEEKKYELTAFQLILQRNLHHLTALWPGRTGFNSAVIQSVKQSTIDGSSFPFQKLGQSVMKFSTAIDENGRNGRQAFFDHVYGLLSEEEKITLAAWDREEYNFRHGG